MSSQHSTVTLLIYKGCSWGGRSQRRGRADRVGPQMQLLQRDGVRASDRRQGRGQRVDAQAGLSPHCRRTRRHLALGRPAKQDHSNELDSSREYKFQTIMKCSTFGGRSPEGGPLTTFLVRHTPRNISAFLKITKKNYDLFDKCCHIWSRMLGIAENGHIQNGVYDCSERY